MNIMPVIWGSNPFPCTGEKSEALTQVKHKFFLIGFQILITSQIIISVDFITKDEKKR